MMEVHCIYIAPGWVEIFEVGMVAIERQLMKEAVLCISLMCTSLLKFSHTFLCSILNDVGRKTDDGLC